MGQELKHRIDPWPQRHPWITASLLYVPMAILFSAYLWLSPNTLWPTGFVHYEHIGYYAMAREHFDSGSFALFFSLPFSPDYHSPSIYFQPQSIFVGYLVHITGFDPGRTYLVIGVISGFIMFRLLIAIYFRATRLPYSLSFAGLIVCAWGGGLLVVGGSIRALLRWNFSVTEILSYDSYYDLWFVNIGRNLYFTNEAYFHCLVLGIIICLWDRRFQLAAFLLIILSMSHPFTGIQILIVVISWSILDTILKKQIPVWFTTLCVVIFVFHCGYYLFLLPHLSPEHVTLVRRWERNFSFTLIGLILAYGLLIPFALRSLARGVLLTPHGRLLAVMAAVSLSLANHQLFVEPRQPLHFTRGYIWLPLFLLALQSVDWFLNGSRTRQWLLAATAALLLVDNVSWIVFQTRNNIIGLSHGIFLSEARKTVLERLTSTEFNGYLLVSSVPDLAYEASAYTALRSWYSHMHSTPNGARHFLETRVWSFSGVEPIEWRYRPLVFVVNDVGQDVTLSPWFTPASVVEQVVVQGEGYWIVRRKPD